MNNLEKIITNLTEENKQLKNDIERFDKTIFELEQYISQLKYLNIKMIENMSNQDLLEDVEYICLKLYIGVEEHQKMLELPFNIEKKYRATGLYPTFQQYHELLIKTLNIPDDEIESFPIKTTLKLVKDKVELGGLTVFNKILDNYYKTK